MKRWLSRLPIRGKLMLLAATVTAVALLIAGTVLVYDAYRGAERALQHRLETQARIVALGSSAALTFNDPEAARNTLEALAGDSAIVAVEIVHADGSGFIEHAFGATGISQVLREQQGLLHVSADVVLDETIGAVHLWASDAELDATLSRALAVLALAVLAALALAMLAASRLQRLVSEPILALAGTAARVSKSHDYSLRVPLGGEDEIGRLVVAFNDMLAQTEAQSSELQRYQGELEQQVASRTAALESALADAQAAARAKAEFLANMSHEIRTPMNGVIGMLELMDGEGLDGQRRGMLDTARSSAESLLAIINDVLDFSKIDAGKLVLEQIDVELRPLAEEVSTLFARQAHGKGIEVTCLVESGVPAIVSADPTRLRQVLANLMGNAVKFTERGEVSLSIRVLEAAGEHASIEITIRDTGVGMTEETLAKLFQSFTQADSSTTRRFGGTGLGLAISKRLIAAMGGEIAVSSTPYVGSTFTITLPLPVRAWVAPSRRSGLKGFKVLIVDDNATNRLVLEHHLAAWQMHFESAASALEGLDLARAAAAAGRPFDMVLLDHQMPQTDGTEFLRILRTDPAIARIECLVLSSLGERRPDADELAVAAWLNKPVRQSQLYSALAMVAGISSGWARGRPRPLAEAQSSARKFAARVLLVEDNLVNQQVAMRMLATFGIVPQIAGNGLEGLERLQSEHFDLVLMDCQMPVMDGYEASREIRRWESDTARKRVPIVAMTANAMKGDRERCLEAGMDDYVSKPVTRTALGEVLGRWLPSAPASGSAVKPSPGTPPAGEDVLDRSTLEQLRELFDGDLSEVVGAFLGDTPAQLKAMTDAIAQKDHEVLARAAHSLRSSSRSLGAHAIAQLATRLEALARASGSFEAANEVVRRLQSAYELLVPQLEEAIGNRGLQVADRSG